MALQKALSLAQQQPTQPPQRQSAPPAPIPYIGHRPAMSQNPSSAPSLSGPGDCCVRGLAKRDPPFTAKSLRAPGPIHSSRWRTGGKPHQARFHLGRSRSGHLSDGLHQARYYWRVKHHCKHWQIPACLWNTQQSALQGAIQKLAYQL